MRALVFTLPHREASRDSDDNEDNRRRSLRKVQTFLTLL
jgi:hypothetical protein